jgi:AcrR family transcriptional regulator
MSRLNVEMPARAYRAQRRPERTERTRERIVGAVHELLEEGTFHESTVEQVAQHAGVSRATLYQHFNSRLELVDAICDKLAFNPALLAIRESIGLPDLDQALDETLANAVRFWSSEDRVLSQLYGVVAIDPAAQAFVDRQRDDRRGEITRLARRLKSERRLPKVTNERSAFATLMLLTSYDTFRELRTTGLSDRDLTKKLQESARALLLGG